MHTILHFFFSFLSTYPATETENMVVHGRKLPS